jgi:hypothetical protein
MPLKALDVVVVLAMASDPQPPRTYSQLASVVGLSASEAHQAVRRAMGAGLLRPGAARSDKPQPQLRALLDFLEHGIRHVFFTSPGKVVRGVPTAHSAPPLSLAVQAGDELPLVWATADGPVRGRAVEPLYRTVPAAALRNPRLYELLALVDALRCGSARERKLAMHELERRLTHAAA